MVLSAGQGHRTSESGKPSLHKAIEGKRPGWSCWERKSGGDGRGPPLVFLLGSRARGEVGKALPGIINRLSIKDLIYSSI